MGRPLEATPHEARRSTLQGLAPYADDPRVHATDLDHPVDDVRVALVVLVTVVRVWSGVKNDMGWNRYNRHH
jgi:hypothetical protein